MKNDMMRLRQVLTLASLVPLSAAVIAPAALAQYMLTSSPQSPSGGNVNIFSTNLPSNMGILNIGSLGGPPGFATNMIMAPTVLNGAGAGSNMILLSPIGPGGAGSGAASAAATAAAAAATASGASNLVRVIVLPQATGPSTSGSGPISPVDQNRPSLFMAPGGSTSAKLTRPLHAPRICTHKKPDKVSELIATLQPLPPLSVKGDMAIFRAEEDSMVRTPFGVILSKSGAAFAIMSEHNSTRIFNLTGYGLQFALTGGECLVVNPGTEILISKKAIANPRQGDDGIARRSLTSSATWGNVSAYFTQFSLASMLKRPEFKSMQNSGNADERKLFKNVHKMALVTMYMYGLDGFNKEKLTAANPKGVTGEKTTATSPTAVAESPSAVAPAADRAEGVRSILKRLHTSDQPKPAIAAKPPEHTGTETKTKLADKSKKELSFIIHAAQSESSQSTSTIPENMPDWKPPHIVR